MVEPPRSRLRRYGFRIVNPTRRLAVTLRYSGLQGARVLVHQRYRELRTASSDSPIFPRDDEARKLSGAFGSRLPRHCNRLLCTTVLHKGHPQSL